MLALIAPGSCDKDSVQFWLNKSIEFYNYSHPQNDRLDAALLCADKSISIGSNNSISWFQKAMILNAMTDYEQAISCLDKATELDPLYFDAWFHKGRSLSKKEIHRYDDAIKCYDICIQLKKDRNDAVAAWDQKGISFMKMGRYKEAIDSLNRSIKINPESYYSYEMMGLTLVYLSNYESALNCYEKAIHLVPAKNSMDRRHILMHKGLALLFIEDYERSQRCFSEALEIDPYSFQCQFFNGLALQYMGDNSEADNSFEECINILKRDIESGIAFGLVNKRNQDLDVIASLK
jgi:tetratricopeptide (TPR) repeat protein